MSKIRCSLAMLFACWVFPEACIAQTDSADTTEVYQGLVFDGMLLPGEAFLAAKYEYLFNNSGIQITVAGRGNNRRFSSDQSVDQFRMIGYGITYRYYLPRYLQGLYGGIALSSATVFLATSHPWFTARDGDFLNLGGFEFGYRWTAKNGKLVAEAGLRRMYSFNKLTLSTYPQYLRDLNLQQEPHRWEIGPGQSLSQLYAGLGYFFLR